MRYLTFLYFLLSAMSTALFLASCSPTVPFSGNVTAENPQQSDGLATPAGADPAVMALLRQELDRQLLAQGVSRSASKVATSTENRVTTLQQSHSGGVVTVSWLEKAVGDYNQDGTVNAADLAPVGINWMKTSADASWASAEAADGDENGVINISDVTPIGRNYGNQLVEYQVYTGATCDFSSCNLIDSQLHGSAVQVGSKRRYSVSFNEMDTGICFFVAPSDGTNTGIESLPSNFWGSQNWAHATGFYQFSEANDIAYDTVRQAYYVTGLANSESHNYSRDFALAKYDTNGNAQWARCWGGDAEDEGIAVATGPDGSIYQAGLYDSYGATPIKLVVLKWDPSGNLLWGRSWCSTGSYDVSSCDVAVDASGNAYINMTVGDGTTAVIMLLGYTTDGGLIGAVTEATSGTLDGAGGIAVDSSGVYCSGSRPLGTGSQYVPVLMCYSSALSLQWGMIYDSSTECWGGKLALDQNHIYMSGSTGSDALVLSLDKTGALLWNSASGSAGQDSFSGIAVDAVGNVFVSVVTDSLGVQYQGLLQKYNPAGTVKWTALWDGTTDSKLTGITMGKNGMLACCGTTTELNHDWAQIGLPSYSLTFITSPLGGPDVPLTGVDGDATSIGSVETITPAVDYYPGGDPSFTIMNYNPQ